MKQLILLFFIILSHVSITFSQKAEKLFENGKISYKERNYEAALKDFDQCIEKEGLADCYAWRATTYYALKKYDNALQDINTAFSKNPDPPAWYYTAKGRIYINMREYKTALPFIQKAIDLETGDKPYYERGYIYYYTYEYNKALTDFTSALNQKPFALAIYYRGLTYQTLGNMENALKDARMINEKYADSYLGFFLMGYIYLYDRKYDQAINSLEEALKKQPRDMLTFEYLGKAYYYKNDFQKALSYFNQAIEVTPRSGNYLFKGRIYYYGLQNTQEAAKWFEKAIEFEKDNRTTVTPFALIFLGREEEAINMQLKTLNEAPTPDNLMAMASYYSLCDRESDAVSYMDKALTAGYPKSANLLALTDLDNIKLKKSFRDVLDKHSIPYDLDNKSMIQVYVKNTVNKWQQRGKYEKADEYMGRVSEASRKKFIEDVTKEAIQYVGRIKVEPVISRTEYNADAEAFRLYFKGGQQAMVKVPAEEAKVFDANVSKLEINMTFALNNSEDFVVEQIVVKNPTNNKTYKGGQDVASSFSAPSLSLDFAPVQTYIDKYKQKQTETPAASEKINSKSAVDENIPYSDRKKDKTFAMVVGNEDYSTFQPDMNAEVNVDYAINDAKVFKQYLIKTMGVPEENIFLLANATAGQMQQGINKLEKLAKAYNGEAELIFFFAGHGLPDENSRESYIMPVDISGSTIQYGLKLNDVYAQLSAYPTKRILVFLDACFSGGARNEALVKQRSIKVNPKANNVPDNMVVFASSSGTQSSMALDNEQHGLFTYFLLKKIKETKGDITLDALGKYLETEVNRKAILVKNKEQTPQIIINQMAPAGILVKKLNE